MTATAKNLLTGFLTITILLAVPVLASAQIDGLPSEPDAPIDGGLSLLVAAGLGYGVRKLEERRKAPGQSTKV